MMEYPGKSKNQRNKVNSFVRSLNSTFFRGVHRVSASKDDEKHNRRETSQSSSASTQNSLGTLPASSHISWSRKIGTFGVVVLILGNIIITGGLAFLVFLWISNQDNTFWKWIVTTGHLQAFCYRLFWLTSNLHFDTMRAVF